MNIFRLISLISLLAISGCQIQRAPSSASAPPKAFSPALLGRQFYVEADDQDCDEQLLEQEEFVPFEQGTLQFCLYQGIKRFRHPFGIQSVRANASGEVVVLFPPGLDRKQQLEFYAAIDEHAMKINQAYWEYANSILQVDSAKKQIELASALVESQRERLLINETTKVALSSSQIDLKTYQLRLLQSTGGSNESSGFFGARQRLHTLCGFVGEPVYNVGAEELRFDRDQFCLSCDKATATSANAQLLQSKYEYINAVNSQMPCASANSSRWSLNKPNPKTYRLPNSAWDLVAQREQAVLNQLTLLLEQIVTLEKARQLLGENVELQKETVASSKTALVAGRINKDQLLQAKLNLEKMKLELVQSSIRMRQLQNAYCWNRGSLLIDNRFLFPNFWVTEHGNCEQCDCQFDVQSPSDTEFLGDPGLNNATAFNAVDPINLKQ